MLKLFTCAYHCVSCTGCGGGERADSIRKSKFCRKCHEESIMEIRSKSSEEQENGGQFRYMKLFIIIKVLICRRFKGNIEKVVVLRK